VVFQDSAAARGRLVKFVAQSQAGLLPLPVAFDIEKGGDAEGLLFLLPHPDPGEGLEIPHRDFAGKPVVVQPAEQGHAPVLGELVFQAGVGAHIAVEVVNGGVIDRPAQDDGAYRGYRIFQETIQLQIHQVLGVVGEPGVLVVGLVEGIAQLEKGPLRQVEGQPRRGPPAILGSRGIPAAYGGFETFAEELSTRLVQNFGVDVTVYCEEDGNPAPAFYRIRAAKWGPLSTILFDLKCLWHASRRFDLILYAGLWRSSVLFSP